MELPSVKCLLLGLVALVLVLTVEAARPQGNCGLSCYRWKKCKSKMSTLLNTNGQSRPGQSGNTGQLFFTKCGEPPTRCPCEYVEPTPAPLIPLPRFPKKNLEFVNNDAKSWLTNFVEFYDR